MMFRAIVIDDEPLNREELIYLLSLHPDVVVAGEAADTASGWKLVEETGANIVLLDIHMEQETAGLDLGLKLKRLNPSPRLIFVTGHPERALAAYDCQPDHFLVKPVDDKKLAEALTRAREALLLGQDLAPIARLPLPYAEKDRFGEIQRITAYAFPHEIIFVKTGKVGAHDTVQVCLNDRTLINVRRRLGELEAELTPFGFFRAHKSVLVNLSRVVALKPRPGEELFKIELNGTDEEVPVARERVAAIRLALEKPLDRP